MITGVRITGGKRDPDRKATDAAIVAKFSSVQISEVEIVDNTHQLEDVVVGIGGIFGRENSELVIQNNVIRNNGWDGIALYRGAMATIMDNEISKGRGAGIGITWDAVATVHRNRISEYWKGIGTFGKSWAVVRMERDRNLWQILGCCPKQCGL
jgi:parallel beta-helix repeat protein